MEIKVRERSGAWWIYVDWKGRRKAKRAGVGKAEKKAAEAAAERIQAKLALGDHHSIKITVDIYGHLVPEADRAAVDRLDDVTGGNLYASAAAPR